MTTDRLFAAELQPSRKRFDDAIGLLHDAHVPALRYAAGLDSSGSDVLGLDTRRSIDRGSGPRVVTLFPETVPRSTRDETSRRLGGIDQSSNSADGREWIAPVSRSGTHSRDVKHDRAQ